MRDACLSLSPGRMVDAGGDAGHFLAGIRGPLAVHLREAQGWIPDCRSS